MSEATTPSGASLRHPIANLIDEWMTGNDSSMKLADAIIALPEIAAINQGGEPVAIVTGSLLPRLFSDDMRITCKRLGGPLPHGTQLFTTPQPTPEDAARIARIAELEADAAVMSGLQRSRERAMNDRELLERAAKVYGLQVKGWVGDKLSYFDPISNWAGLGDWNPLTDDGDEARLEAALSLSVIWNDDSVFVGQCDDTAITEYFSDHDGDKQMTRRRAGVRAAAAMCEQG